MAVGFFLLTGFPVACNLTPHHGTGGGNCPLGVFVARLYFSMPDTFPKKRGPQSEKQKEASRKTLAALRKANPEKFDPRKNGASEKWKAKAEAKARVKAEVAAALQSRSEPPPATPAPQPVKPAPEIPPAKPAPALPDPAPVKPASPAPATSPAKPDTALFAETVPPPQLDGQTAPPGNSATAGTPPPGENFNPPPPGGQNAAPPAGGISPTQDTRKLAITVWAMIVNLLVAIFGDALAPRRIETAPGQFYDENEMMIGAWADYLVSLGIKPLTPLMNLWLAHCAYLLPRLTVIVTKIKSWLNKKPPVGSRGAPAPEAKPDKPQSESPAKPEAKPPTETTGTKPGPQAIVPDNDLGDS